MIRVQRDSFPAPLPSGKALFGLQKINNVLSSSVRRIIHLKNPNGERIKVDRKGISPGRIS